MFRKQCLDKMCIINTMMGKFTDGLRNIAPLDTHTLFHIIKLRCSVIQNFEEDEEPKFYFIVVTLQNFCQKTISALKMCQC